MGMYGFLSCMKNVLGGEKAIINKSAIFFSIYYWVVTPNQFSKIIFGVAYTSSLP